jgi:hypothetical protein
MVSGTAWTLSNATASFSSTGTTLVVSGLSSASYSFTVGTSISPDGQTRYVPGAAKVTANVHSNVTVPVPFATQFRLTVSAVGPGTATPPTTWVGQAASFEISASPAGTATFLGWSGTGTGSYTGPNENATIAATGPITEIASFVNAPTAVGTTSSASSSLWTNPLVWVALAAVGLVVGLVVGAVLSRNRRSPPAAWEESSAPTSPEPAYSEDSAPPEGAPPEGPA